MIAPDAALPHGGVALFVTEVTCRDDHGLTATARVDPRHPLVLDGRVPSSLAIEAAAQAAGLHGALGGTPVGEGYLVSVSRCELHESAFRAGESFELRVEHVRSAGNLHRWRFHALRQGDALAGGELSVWSG